MPVRVSQAPGSSTLTTSYTHQQHRMSPASLRGGDESSSADSRHRRLLQKDPQESNHIMSTRSNSSLRSAFREPPSPQKPRSSGHDRRPTLSSKPTREKLNSGIKSNTASAASTINSARGYLQPPEATSNVTTFYAFGQNADEELEPADFEFSPSVNLEDVHRSIITDDADPVLSQFPLPGRNIGGNMNSSGGASQPASSAAGSVIRKPSVGKFSNSNANQEQGSYRQRRISNATGSISKLVPGDNTAARAQRRRPSIASSLNSVNSLTPPIPSKEYSSGTGHARNAQEARAQVANNPNRTTKAKSLQPPPRPQVITSAPLKPALTPEHARPSSFATVEKSPNRLHKSAIPAPGSSRRISTVPYASGLGARTISPTDARRLKRLSTIRTPPPPVDSQRTTPASPSLHPCKSITPSSSANTPEPMRKSYSSGISTASTTPSARTSTASLQPRLSQNLSLSRLPTAKVSRQSNEEDEIPPVPPLPKSLVSPPTMSAEFPEQSSVPPQPPKHREITPIRVSTEDTPELAPTGITRRRRGMTLGVSSKVSQTLEPKASVSSLNKKNLAPLRLPPLNLLPLSTPTISRVNALGNTSDTEELTPPRRYGHKTPSTPMTASKATFFGRSSVADGPVHQRSTSSFNHASSRIPTPELGSFRGDSSASSSLPISASSRFGRETISPYVPQPLPRQSLDYGQGPDSNPVPEIKSSSRILGLPMPRDKSRQQKHKEEVQAQSQPQERDTPDTPSSSSSLRRKLSLSWKRGTKTSHAASERESEYPPKYDGMPPPRLPASATWAGAESTPSPSKASHGRRKSIITIGTTSGHDRTKSESWGSNTTGSPRRELKTEDASAYPPQYQAYHPPTQNNMGPPPQPSAKSSTASSILSPVHKMLSNKTSIGQIRRDRDRDRQPYSSHDPSLDADDLIAEEEMRKLASKRKNLESATQELESLQRRAVPKEKLSPTQALRSVSLNIFERGEIVDYKDVYFFGTESAKKHTGDPSSQSANFGYDDDRGDYMIIKGDHLAYRYEIIDVLGKGSFGQVVRCIDHKTGGLVAIKIIRNKKRFHQQALVEVNILQKLKEWDPQKKHSLISFTQSFYFRGHLCISTELLGMNLYEFIKSNDFRGFSLRLIRRFTKQLLSGLLLLKGHRVIHCDLKPENVLLAAPNKGEIKMIDFGSSCFEHEKVYTYIQSRFYRSPEVILGMTYGLPIDIWSLGCILAELYTGYPIFPGENEQEQLACIMEVFGPPEKHLIEKSTRKKLFFDSFGKPRVIVSSKGRRRRPSSKTLSQALKCDDEAFLDFITRCLRWDPDKRLKPDEAMHHDFITGRKTSTRLRGSSAQSSTDSASTRSRYGSGTQSYGVSGSRPLPEPPASSKASSKPSGHLSYMSQSPNKSYGSLANGTAGAIVSTANGVGTSGHLKRNSTVSSTASNGGGTKRTSIGGAGAGSSLPRVAAATRSTSGKVGTPPVSNGVSLRTRI
ncbi:hypothetical protein EV426DRAFT_709465 [Tirmania nivea]|nr:hypothetical protein EV426DRAFT_709465 [Tirmania nivea]